MVATRAACLSESDLRLLQPEEDLIQLASAPATPVVRPKETVKNEPNFQKIGPSLEHHASNGRDAECVEWHFMRLLHDLHPNFFPGPVAFKSIDIC